VGGAANGMPKNWATGGFIGVREMVLPMIGPESSETVGSAALKTADVQSDSAEARNGRRKDSKREKNDIFGTAIVARCRDVGTRDEGM